MSLFGILVLKKIFFNERWKNAVKEVRVRCSVLLPTNTIHSTSKNILTQILMGVFDLGVGVKTTFN
jgi:hypothetical protein